MMSEMPLYQNILQQRAAMMAASKKPRALRIDSDSMDALQREVGAGNVLIVPGNKVCGLVIENSHEPTVEVVE
jgi:hypothetical protein